MSHINIPVELTHEYKPLTAYLALAFRNNILALEHYRKTIEYLLDETTGHKHDGTYTERTYNFEDTIRIVTGKNDYLDFRFADPDSGYASAIYNVQLDPDTYELNDLADYIETKMKAEVFDTNPVLLSCFYDSTVDSKTRGLFVFQSTAGGSGARFELLGATGANRNRSVLPSIGFALLDYKKSSGYCGESGFLSSFVANKVRMNNGIRVPEAGFQDEAFATDKYLDGICQNRNFQNGSVGGGETQAHALIGSKWARPTYTTTQTLLGSGTFTLNIPNKSSSADIPVVKFFVFGNTTPIESHYFDVSVSYNSGTSWDINYINNSGITLLDCMVVIW